MGSGPFIIGVGDTVCGRNGIVIGSDGADCICTPPSGIFNCLRTGPGGSPATANLTLDAILRTRASGIEPACPCALFVRTRIYGTQSGSETPVNNSPFGCGLGGTVSFSIPGLDRDAYGGNCPGGPITNSAYTASVGLGYTCQCEAGNVFTNTLQVSVGVGFAANISGSFAAEINLVDGSTTITSPPTGGTLSAFTVGLSGGTLSIFMSYSRVTVQTGAGCPPYDRIEVTGSTSITVNNLVGCDPGTCNDDFFLVGSKSQQPSGAVRLATAAEVRAIARGGRVGGCSSCNQQEGLE